MADTGAKLSCINADWLEALETINNTRYLRQPAEVTLVGANDTKLQCSEVVYLAFRAQHTQIQWPFHVVQNLQPHLIAGIDLLSALRARVDTANNNIEFRPHEPERGISISARQRQSSLPSQQEIVLIAQQDVRMDSNSTSIVQVQAKTQDNKLAADTLGVAECIYDSIIPGIVTADSNGITSVAAVNASVLDYTIQKGDIVGVLSPLVEPETSWKSVEQVFESITPVQTPTAAAATPSLSSAQMQHRQKKLKDMVKINCPQNLRQSYLDLILEFADVFSIDENDLGLTNVYEHRIDLTTDKPVHVKQFRLPMAQEQFITDRVRHLALQNAIEPSTSVYNTPIFAVPKKTLPGEPPKYRLIQDLRSLNAITKPDKHSICDVRTCLDKIGALQATVFSSIDLRAGYYQMALAKESRPYTAFTIPSLGTWQWAVTTMGLTGAPASFSKLMEKVMQGLKFILRYLDDLLAASRTHEEHLKHLREAFMRLRQFNLKINPEKSTFAAPSVEYLGHTVSKDGFTVGEHKFLAIKNFPEPNSKKKVQQFLGLANFFRQLIPNFQQYAGKLSCLVRKDHPWKMGLLPPEARSAFSALRNALLTRPVIAFPDPSKPFVLSTDAAVGDDSNPGGLGAVLTQFIEGHDKVIAYASRALKQHERNQSAFQLELQAVIWALEHFGPYLRHNTFEVITDHKPVANLSKQQLKSLHRLHEKMLEYPCNIKYRPGILNDVADALSRNVQSINPVDAHDIKQMQLEDAMCRDIIRILAGCEKTAKQQPRLFAHRDRFMRQNGLLCIHDPQAIPEGKRIVVPRAAKAQILRAAHDHPLAGHLGTNKTAAAVAARFWWPNMHQEVAFYVKNCAQCQKSKNPPDFLNKMPLHPIQPPHMPNERCHCDLFGPIPQSTNGNKWILTMTCAFSKFVRVIPLPNKEAKTVAQAIFTHWIAVFGPMQRLIHDQGREFHSSLLQQLLQLLHIEQRTTSAMAPSVNGEAEIFNKWIAAYLRKAEMKEYSEWEGHLAALNLAYNTAVHSAHNRQPAAVMFGRRFIMPHLDIIPPEQPKLSWAQQQQQQLQQVWQHTRTALAATANNMVQQQKQTRQFIPLQGERVLLYYPRSALAAKGPPKLQQQWKEAVILAQLAPATFLARLRFTGTRPTMVHANRIKPFLPRLVLPQTEWCVDPEINQVAATAHEDSTSRACCPHFCPCKKKKEKKEKKKGKNGERNYNSWQSSPRAQQAEENKYSYGWDVPSQQQQQPSPAPYWLRGTPQPHPTPRTPAQQQQQQQEFDSPAFNTRSSSKKQSPVARFFSRIRSPSPTTSPAPTTPAIFHSCSEGSASSKEEVQQQQLKPQQPQAPRPSTRAHPGTPPTPTTTAAAPRALRRLATSLLHFPKFVKEEPAEETDQQQQQQP